LTPEFESNQAVHGPDLSSNSRLAFAVTKAKKGSCPKAVIDAAIARGQNCSESGDLLRPLLEEFMFPPGIAIVVDCATDNKAKLRMELRTVMKKHGAAPSSISYLFQKKGAIKFKRRPGVDLEAVLLSALDAGALDAEEDEGGYLVSTDASDVSAVCEALERGLSLEIESADVIWDPETRLISVSEQAAQQLLDIELQLKEMPSVNAMYTNAPLR
jgi:transcriptional/translational regulatory protein YebC/TACO1